MTAYSTRLRPSQQPSPLAQLDLLCGQCRPRNRAGKDPIAHVCYIHIHIHIQQSEVEVKSQIQSTQNPVQFPLGTKYLDSTPRLPLSLSSLIPSFPFPFSSSSSPSSSRPNLNPNHSPSHPIPFPSFPSHPFHPFHPIHQCTDSANSLASQ